MVLMHNARGVCLVLTARDCRSLLALLQLSSHWLSQSLGRQYIVTTATGERVADASLVIPLLGNPLLIRNIVVALISSVPRIKLEHLALQSSRAMPLWETLHTGNRDPGLTIRFHELLTTPREISKISIKLPYGTCARYCGVCALELLPRGTSSSN
ncbi:hypothetical protein EDD15DRAFT_1544519 [Pisolithus albus]|nr:hypothetical protein EDD15DRAFT_1544519 [Pisolithus albus]